MSNRGTREQQARDASYAAALARLPVAYASILHLTDAGTTADEICARLGVEPDTFGLLLEVAHRKLRAELSRSAQIDPESPE